jgi:hypothetical protein
MARPHTTQPTFYLTLAGVGLAQAYESNAAAWQHRLRGFPEFLASAQAQISSLPRLFQAHGLKMAQTLKAWLETLAAPPGAPGDLKPALRALEGFRAHLERVPTHSEFRLPAELYARIAHTHLGIGLSLEAIAEELDAELEETREILREESARLAPGRLWHQVLAQLEFNPPLNLSGDINGYNIYRQIITRLESHCIAQGLVTESDAAASPVTVAAVPDYLIPMRSAAAYSMVPGHPATGGTFYLLPGDLQRRPAADIHLLSAHETYPGHHLLDTARWNLGRPLRRHLEFPLFYEGWASFAEELLFDTGFCAGSRERLLMAKRRYYRALRGKADLMLNQGRWSRATAADHLHQAGYPSATAERMLSRYALKPGYQLCYSMGRRRFHELYAAWLARGGRLEDFCAQVLSGGEVHFNDLKARFQAPNQGTG